jgi:hypothetical protein
MSETGLHQPEWESQQTLRTFAVALIGAPLLDRRPPAVTRSIIAFIIDPSYQVLRRWPATHIGEEGCEASAPSHANFDAAAAIRLKPDIARAVAALHYPLPSFVFRRLGTRLAMGSVRCFGGQATTTSCVTGTKALPANDSSGPALAQNEETPMDLTTRTYIRVGLSRNEEAAKSPANHFYRGHVGTIAGRSSERMTLRDLTIISHRAIQHPAPSHHGLSLAAFITNIAESNSVHATVRYRRP